MKKNITESTDLGYISLKYNQDQSSIMLLLVHNFSHAAVVHVLRVMLKSITLKFSSIMYLTLPGPSTM